MLWSACQRCEPRSTQAASAANHLSVQSAGSWQDTDAGKIGALLDLVGDSRQLVMDQRWLLAFQMWHAKSPNAGQGSEQGRPGAGGGGGEEIQMQQQLRVCFFAVVPRCWDARLTLLPSTHMVLKLAQPAGSQHMIKISSL
jgi:hypothetical protein